MVADIFLRRVAMRIVVRGDTATMLHRVVDGAARGLAGEDMFAKRAGVPARRRVGRERSGGFGLGRISGKVGALARIRGQVLVLRRIMTNGLAVISAQ